MQIRKTELELLAPAGSYETFQAVVDAGADAVYLGGSRYGARAYADNFTEEEVLRAIDEAHIHGRKVYLTVNTLFKEKELAELYDYLLPFYEQGLDAVIVQDVGVFALVRREFPDLPIHASTQMTVTSSDGAYYLKELGASRIVTAREMSLAEIGELHRQVADIEIETFVHGALCYCYSGQCLLSSMIGGRSGNRGRCAQPCRLPYEVYDIEHKRVRTQGNYVLSTKDLCGIFDIPALAESGVCSLKIEGRMKQKEYAAGVVAVYRGYIDHYLAMYAEARGRGKDEAEARKYARERFAVSQEDHRLLLDLGNRSGFTDTYYHQQNGADMISFEKPGHERSGKDAFQRAGRTSPVERKEKINGILRLKKGLPAMIEVDWGEYAVLRSGATVQQAKMQPLTAKKVEECIRKTGNTPFVFEELSIEMDNEVFLPVQAINELRREALDALTCILVEEYRRSAPEHTEAPCERKTEYAGEDESRIIVSVEERFQIDETLEHDFVTDVYLDSACYVRKDLFAHLGEDVIHIHQAGKLAYYILPAIFRGKTAAFYGEHREELLATGVDGVVVKSYDAAAFVRAKLGRDFPLILDHNLYTWNHAAKEQLGKLGPLRDTAPLELNRKELLLRDNRGSELVIYGYLPLVTSAQCVHANTGKCDREQTSIYLKDRYNKYFLVKNHCAECYNTIYNTAPLILFSYKDDFRKMGLTAFRISFTSEDASVVKRVLWLCREAFVAEDAKAAEEQLFVDHTGGHYKRGVE